MIKVVSPAGWDFDRHSVVPIKVSSRGLRGNDRQDFLKVASHVFADAIDRLQPQHDEVPVHVIALGASEFHGPNRNGDGFKEATCRRYHDGFRKHAVWYRSHKNKKDNGDPYYGIVKESAYNEKMKRVELLCMLNAEKSAADRNGGFVADKELEKIARGEDIPVSMACHVPFDICDYCGNKARTTSEYCTQEKCAAGGCKDNLTKLYKTAAGTRILHVDNETPRWFDISHVWRPADRIAYATKADYLTKSAADVGGFFGIGGAKTANDLGLSLGSIVPESAHGKLAYGVLLLLNKNAAAQHTSVLAAVHPEVYQPVKTAELMPVESLRGRQQLKALADAGVVMSLRDFAEWTKQAEHVEQARAYTKTALENYVLASDDTAEDVRFKPDVVADPVLAGKLQRVKHAVCLDANALQSRAVSASLRGVRPAIRIDFEKAASFSVGPDAVKLANDYAAYQTSALLEISKTVKNPNNLLLTVVAALGQNQVY